MSIYQFPPAPDFHGAAVSWAWSDNVFTDEELSKIISIGDALPIHESTIVGSSAGENISAEHKIRKSKNAWMPLQDNNRFVYDKLCSSINTLNAQFFQFDIFGFMENLQYTVYLEDNNHYDWHKDKTPNKYFPARKLTAVLMLSNNTDYEGGELQILESSDPKTLEKERGRLYVFPSYLLHRVTPVTKGRRITLVSWVHGNKFR